MKIPKFITLFLLAVVTVSCTFQKTSKAENKKEINNGLLLSRSEIYGKWNQISKVKTYPDYRYIQFNADSTATIQIAESTGKRLVKANWKYDANRKEKSALGSINIKADIEVNFNMDENHRYILLIKLEKEAGKIIMKANKSKFVKE